MMEAASLSSISSSSSTISHLLFLRRLPSPNRSKLSSQSLAPANWNPRNPNSQSKNHIPIRAVAASASSSSSDSAITLLDYGAGNVRSVRNAIKYLGFDIKEVHTPADILDANRLVFPGVGAFAAAMDVLNQKGMAEALLAYLEQDRPFLGICLGLQLLFESSEENGPVKGLGVIPGIVGRFDSSDGLRVPHIGWNSLQISKDSGILDDIGGRHVYFVHSYRAMPSDANKDWISSTCNYGDSFISSINKGNIHAVQFHPEKSGGVGLSILKRFLDQSSSSMTKKSSSGRASKLAKRVIACLDVRSNDNGDLVVTKGDQYDVREHSNKNEVRNLGKPVDLAGQYYEDGADEVSFLNITGFRDFPLGDLPMLQILRHTSEHVFVPLTVGGGIRDFTDGNGRYYSSLEVASEYFRSGADKVSIGSDAVFAAEEFLRTGVKTGKSSIEQISRRYGNQAVVVSIDPRRVYLRSPNEVQFKAVKLATPGPLGEEYAWYQCTVDYFGDAGSPLLNYIDGIQARSSYLTVGGGLGINHYNGGNIPPMLMDLNNTACDFVPSQGGPLMSEHTNRIFRRMCCSHQILWISLLMAGSLLLFDPCIRSIIKIIISFIHSSDGNYIKLDTLMSLMQGFLKKTEADIQKHGEGKYNDQLHVLFDPPFSNRLTITCKLRAKDDDEYEYKDSMSDLLLIVERTIKDAQLDHEETWPVQRF